ncbi:putative Mannosidase, beta A, lysosomal [Operophtera brumata]|uniref:beta-mannosidase n=1 Tax=Operophtera brumata TaxID=104452 RepID=A0A0L7KT42_OPEBR|nr:putative Mannosidase, beta A, lysosomal [Operophtera brumata]
MSPLHNAADTRAMSTLVFLVCFTLVAVNGADGKFSLNSDNKKVTWTLENKNGSISVAGSVPGGVYSDLHTAGVIGHILVGFNDVLTSPLGTTNNMFVRYTFDVKSHLKIHFASPVEAAKIRSDKHFTAPACVPDEYHGECHANQLRKMQASFSWDWGPAFPSVGLWLHSAGIGDQPSPPLDFGKEHYHGECHANQLRKMQASFSWDWGPAFPSVGVDQHWDVRIRSHLESSLHKKHIKGYLSATLSVDGNQSIKVEREVEIQARDDGSAEADLNMTISENVVSLWWPNEYGEQPLYNLDVYLLCLSPKGNIDQASSENKQIGFRTIEVIEEHASSVLVENLLNSAKDAHMAMLRVWGGGVYESDYFYNRCDQLGILIWQDFMFACSMYPTDPEYLDITLQSRSGPATTRTKSPCEATEYNRYKDEYIKLYVNTIKPIVESLDPGRRYLVSSPSNGLESEKEGYIANNPYDSHYGDTHYYNYFGDNWDQNIYPSTRFASEYGFQSLPTLAAMKTATQDEKDFSVDTQTAQPEWLSVHRESTVEAF